MPITRRLVKKLNENAVRYDDFVDDNPKNTGAMRRFFEAVSAPVTTGRPICVCTITEDDMVTSAGSTGAGGVYITPSSFSSNSTIEQNPSIDDMINVLPSLDHVMSVNVA
ncbi:hypothetical protein BSLG_005645 [Batrachochytrium salamandrivorans]|nr:hypothetical protein BSLG_005645 [Batrachochytrium salamandrivorans]